MKKLMKYHWYLIKCAWAWQSLDLIMKFDFFGSKTFYYAFDSPYPKWYIIEFFFCRGYIESQLLRKCILFLCALCISNESKIVLRLSIKFPFNPSLFLTTKVCLITRYYIFGLKFWMICFIRLLEQSLPLLFKSIFLFYSKMKVNLL